ncbi:MAG: adenosylcobinamide-phosphate synthase CbiB [Paracoccaceae bacterium]|nr:adenosylcobinamide-phosphate synthase CbiB [Paracoccaceae bacterium]
MSNAIILLLALLLDALLGEPKWLWSRVPHPAVLMGRLIAWADTSFNESPSQKVKGALVIAALSIAALVFGEFLSNLPGSIQAIIVAIFLAQRSLVDHVQAVADALRLSVHDGKLMVARIVGRDTAKMDAPAVARGAIESAAENLSDGVIAPALWFLVFGLPGLFFYKIINTADSMIGYKTPRHIDFGWAAARLDDLLNWVPARLTTLLIAAGYLSSNALKIAWRDHGLHRSPNAGWPEAAMAGVLDIALSGPRQYHGTSTNDAFVNPEGRHDLDPQTIDASVNVLWWAWAVLAFALVVFALF